MFRMDVSGIHKVEKYSRYVIWYANDEYIRWGILRTSDPCCKYMYAPLEPVT